MDYYQVVEKMQNTYIYSKDEYQTHAERKKPAIKPHIQFHPCKIYRKGIIKKWKKRLVIFRSWVWEKAGTANESKGALGMKEMV